MPSRPDLTTAPIAPALVRLALPMVAGVLAMMGFNMVDAWFVGRLGTDALAALALTFPVVMVVMSLALGLGVSTSIVVSQAIGGERLEDARRLATDALLASLVMTVVLSGAGFVLLRPVLRLLGGTPEVVGLAARYLTIWFAGTAVVVVPMVANMAIRATGDTLTPSLMMILGVVLNGVLDPILMFGAGPAPALGIEGAAWATVISRAVTLVYGLWVLIGRERLIGPLLVPMARILASWKRLASSAVPIAVNNLVTPLMTGVLTRLASGYGVAAVAGLGVAMRVEGVALTPLFALQAVVGVQVGQNLGAGLFDRVRESIRVSSLFGMIWSTATWAVLLLTGARVAGLFDSNPDVITTTALYLSIVGVSFGGRAVYLVCSAILNATNHATAATVVTIVQGAVLAIPLAWAGGTVWGLGGMYAGLALANLAAGALSYWWSRRAVTMEQRRAKAVRASQRLPSGLGGT